jgi:hypothetical protein
MSRFVGNDIPRLFTRLLYDDMSTGEVLYRRMKRDRAATAMEGLGTGRAIQSGSHRVETGGDGLWT